MIDSSQAVTLLGSGGGLAQAVLALLDKAVASEDDPLRDRLRSGVLHLIDVRPQRMEDFASRYPNLAPRIRLHKLDLRQTDAFKKHLSESGTNLVIDVSWADTAKMLECCNELGIAYLNSALENEAVDEDPTLYGFPLTERYERFEEARSGFDKTRAIVCSGMNPGVVQWMAWKLAKDNPGPEPRACYIVEHDSSFYADPAAIAPKTVYASWSAECFLDESILSYPMFVRNGIAHYFREEVYSAEYKVRIGDKEFYGCLMPHEEVFTLGTLRNWEVGFLYRVSEYTTRLIRDRLEDVDELWEWDQEIVTPANGEVEGEDLVGVLLVYDDGEKYMYNVLSSKEIYPVYGTNATYFQVACGVYAALACLVLDPVPNGVHYVDELLGLGIDCRYGEYLGRYMKRIETGANAASDGLLANRRRECPD